MIEYSYDLRNKRNQMKWALILTPSHNDHFIGLYTQHISKLYNFFFAQSFSEQINLLIFHATIDQLHLSRLNLLPNKMIMHLYVFCSSMIDKVPCNLDNTLVITHQRSWMLLIKSQINEYPRQPNYLTSRTNNCFVLNFS